jgi:hypothetical protein
MELRIGRRPECLHCGLVQLDVIRMAVTAVLVVAKDYLRAVRSDRRHDLAHHLLHRRLEETVGVPVVRRTGHAAVPVSVEVNASQAQRLRRAAELGCPKLRGAGVTRQRSRVYCAHVPVGGAGQPHFNALGAILCQGAARAE